MNERLHICLIIAVKYKLGIILKQTIARQMQGYICVWIVFEIIAYSGQGLTVK